MPKYPDMRELARLSSTDYRDITSLEQVSRRERGKFVAGYPGAGTPEWWALRLRVEELIGKERRLAKVPLPSSDELARSEAAKWAALGNEQADMDYQAGA